MNVITLNGSYRDIGEQNGKIVKGYFNPPPSSEKRVGFSRKVEEITNQHCPGMIDEIEAFCDAAELNYEQMKAFLLVLGNEPGCSIYTVKAENTAFGSPVFGRNYDWDDDFQKYFTVFKLELEGVLTSLSFSDHMVGRYGGVNEEGVAVAITAIPAYKGKAAPGVLMTFSVRWILDNMKSTEEAVDWLLDLPHQSAHNFHLGDSKGVFASVEAAPERCEAHYSDEIVVTTNHYHDNKMRELEDPSSDFENSHTRYNRIMNWYDNRKGKLSLEDLKFVLKDHEQGVCDHVVYEGKSAGTIWSWIAPLGKREVYVTAGPPCKNPYEVLKF